MQLHYQALCAALITGTLANPAPGHRPQKGCLTNAAAATLVDSFVSLFVDFEEGVARSILAPDFSEVSDSLNFLDPNNTKLVRANLVTVSMAGFPANFKRAVNLPPLGLKSSLPTVILSKQVFPSYQTLSSSISGTTAIASCFAGDNWHRQFLPRVSMLSS